MPFDVKSVRLRFPGRTILWLGATASTMTEASRLAAGGYASGSVVGAEEQTAGEGRFGRRWHSERGAGLYLSMVLRPRLRTQALPVVTLALGLAAGEAIAGEAGVACDLRWPNDVLVGGRKCAGILLKREGGALIAGIGVNVNQTTFPPELAAAATSLRIETGREQAREALAARLIESVDTHLDLLARRGRRPLLDLFTQASSFARGRRVVVERESGPVEGVTDGLTHDGFLALRTADSRRIIIVAGGVRPA